jgi:hypothetical protein
VLKADKELVMFPIISSVACVLILVSFAVPSFFVAGGFEGIKREEMTQGQQFGLFALSFGFYLGTYFVMTFFNAALVACTVLRLRGGDPTFSYGMAEARDRVGLIFQWALLSATVGMILHAIEERAGWVGRIVSGLLGMAWALAAFFVVPVMVVDRKGPIEALKESAGLFRKSWGERAVAAVSFGLISVALAVPGVLLMLAGAGFLFTSGNVWAAVGLGSAGFLWLMALSLVMGTLQSIFQTALFLYLKDGTVAGGFDREALASAYAAKT